VVEFFEVFENLRSGLLLGVSEGVSELMLSHLSDFFVDFEKTEGIEPGIVPGAMFTAFLLILLGFGGFNL
jgi:hypothetical protein